MSRQAKTPPCYLQRAEPITYKQFLAWGRRGHPAPVPRKASKGICRYACKGCECASKEPLAKSIKQKRYCPVAFWCCEHARWYCIGSPGSDLAGCRWGCAAKGGCLDSWRIDTQEKETSLDAHFTRAANRKSEMLLFAGVDCL
ncbi:MAG: hypothetical protein M0Z52_03945 [Actinomycetota bacterium]|nr:hypothetical protein [Actinomycetota bacterium]